MAINGIGKKKTRPTYSPVHKEVAVKALLETKGDDETVVQLAKRFGCHRQTLYKWRKRYLQGRLNVQPKSLEGAHSTQPIYRPAWIAVW